MLTWDDIKNTSKENAWKMLYSAGQTLGTPIVKSLANIGALGATGWGAIQMARNKPESAERAFNKALTARQFAGTEGSFDQGIESGKNTLLRGTLSAGQTALTGLGLPHLTVGKLATAGVIGGGLNKVMGGDFSTGAGQAMGSLPQILGFVATTNPMLAKYLPKSSGVTNRILGSVGNVTQGVGMDLARGMPTTPTSMAIDAITGAMGGTSQFDMPKINKSGIVDQSIEMNKPIKVYRAGDLNSRRGIFVTDSKKYADSVYQNNNLKTEKYELKNIPDNEKFIANSSWDAYMKLFPQDNISELLKLEYNIKNAKNMTSDEIAQVNNYYNNRYGRDLIRVWSDNGQIDTTLGSSAVRVTLKQRGIPSRFFKRDDDGLQILQKYVDKKVGDTLKNKGIKLIEYTNQAKWVTICREIQKNIKF